VLAASPRRGFTSNTIPSPQPSPSERRNMRSPGARARTTRAHVIQGIYRSSPLMIATAAGVARAAGAEFVGARGPHPDRGRRSFTRRSPCRRKRPGGRLSCPGLARLARTVRATEPVHPMQMGGGRHPLCARCRAGTTRMRRPDRGTSPSGLRAARGWSGTGARKRSPSPC